MSLAHNVFFTLQDKSPTAVQKLVDDCQKYLTIQPGMIYFACGKIEPELDRDVNVRDWDVGLHIIFKDRAAHDAYQEDASHEHFIEENKANWTKVRVFDSLVNGKIM